jgi:hypothetical protein
MARGENVPAKYPAPLPSTLRQTLLTTFDACQYSAYLSVVTDGLEPSHPLFRGRAFHEVADRCTRAMLANGEVTISPDDAKAVMLEVLEDHPEWVIPAYAQDELRVMVHRWARFFTLPGPHCATEHKFALEVEGQSVTGTIDLLWRDGDTVHIRDYKAGWLVYTQADVSGTDEGKPRGARAPQLITYALLVADGKTTEKKLPFDLRGVNYFDCRFVFPMAGGDDGMLERHVTISRPELIEHREWLAGNVRKMVNRFEAQRFTAVQGSHCSRCADRSACPLLANASARGPFERPAAEAVEDWWFLDQDAKRMWAEIKTYVDQLGPVPFGKDQEVAKTATASGTRLVVRKRAA